MRQMESCGPPEEKWTRALSEEEKRVGRSDSPAFCLADSDGQVVFLGQIRNGAGSDESGDNKPVSHTH